MVETGSQNQLHTSASNLSPTPTHRSHLAGIKQGVSVDSSRLLQHGRKMSIDDIEIEQCKLEPKVEGRIVIINDEVNPFG